ncbi:MAG: hypothetical protein ACOY0R_07310 [Chloroflexota bacterium]
MSKGNNDQDETPIQFHIPSMRRSGQAPIPLNQPHWKYGRSDPARYGGFEWFASVLMLLMSLSLLLSAILGPSFAWPLFPVSLVLTLATAWSLGSMMIQTWKHRSLRKDKRKAPPKRTRQPRRRKDYG